MGDSEEHAMLLCNYFNYIDLVSNRQAIGNDASIKQDYESYIVYGEAQPIGECWFVARRDKKLPNIELWNPMTGECYTFDRQQASSASALAKSSTSANATRENDPRCPLKKIWCVVGQENVWANIQPEDNPVLLNFDLGDKTHWAQFLTK